MKRVWANTMTALGLLLLSGAIALTGWNLRESRQAGEASRQIAQELMERIADPAGRPGTSALTEEKTAEETEQEAIPTMTVDKNGYIGVLEIPDQGLTLPIAADWDYDQLKISPCRFSGTAMEKNLIICAHNYLRHFWNLLNIDMETEVFFTTVDGQVHRYLVTNREIVDPMDLEGMMDNESNDWALTLFTCTLGGETRCAVRCVETEL